VRSRASSVGRRCAHGSPAGRLSSGRPAPGKQSGARSTAEQDMLRFQGRLGGLRPESGRTGEATGDTTVEASNAAARARE
jgi:hypothetical protein